MIARPFRRRGAQQENRPPRTPRFKIITSVVVVVVLAAAAYGGWVINQELHTCASSAWTDVQHAPGGECVGVTDGSWPFRPQLKSIEADIKQENDRVQKIPGHETMAFLLPVDQSGEGLQTTQDTLEQLQGAYAAQRYFNHYAVNDHLSPPIRLLIASSGTQANYHSITDPILESDVSSQRLDAIAGISLSLDSTDAEVKTLTGYGIPVIGSIITGDEFSGGYAPLVRVSPSNADQVQAMLRYIKPKFDRFTLVQDDNPADQFSQSLGQEFKSEFESNYHQTLNPQTFDSSGESGVNSPAGQQVQNRMDQVTDSICSDSSPEAVLFGGRGQDLGRLIKSLAGRNCSSTPVTVVTGDAITNITAADLKTDLSNAGKISVLDMGEASGDEWNYASNSAQYKALSPETVAAGKSGFHRFHEAVEFTKLGVNTADGDAMMGYDAALTSIFAIRLADINHGTSPRQALRDVSGEFNAIQGNQILNGASGPIQFHYFPGNPQRSDPFGKVVPILQVQPDGTPKLIALEP